MYYQIAIYILIIFHPFVNSYLCDKCIYCFRDPFDKVKRCSLYADVYNKLNNTNQVYRDYGDVNIKYNSCHNSRNDNNKCGKNALNFKQKNKIQLVSIDLNKLK